MSLLPSSHNALMSIKAIYVFRTGLINEYSIIFKRLLTDKYSLFINEHKFLKQ